MDERGSARILYVGGDPAVRSSLRDSLCELGYAVGCSPDAQDGLAALVNQRTDLVLVDLALDGMDPFDLCRRIKMQAGPRFVPVVFLTGATDVATRVRALEGGGDDVWVEPMRLDEIDARLRAFLRRGERDRSLASQSARFRLLAYSDGLTELGNRRALERDLGRAWARAIRSQQPLAICLMDLDHFKSFNDRNGHASGDEILRGVARVIEASIRKGDQAFRIGGEEFLVLAPDTALAGALVLAERMRVAVGTARIAPPPDAASSALLAVTVSVGVAVVPDPGIDSEAALLEAADRALYDAKATGRDRVVASAGRPLDAQS